ncbi:MAG: very short patch repair endonuclease [Steroidobacteraceae bacterium]
MTDVFIRKKRSDVMSRIRGRGNESTELQFAKLLRSEGITGWRRHVELTLGVSKHHSHICGRRRRTVRPDFVFKRERVAVFVDGCFWHGCPKHSVRPRQNEEFWSEKLAHNRTRDSYVTRALRRRGWRVMRVWEHALHPSRSKSTLNLARRMIEKGMRLPS